MGNLRSSSGCNIRNGCIVEDVCDPQTKADMNVSLGQDWHDRFAAEKHNDLSHTPDYLVRDGSFAEGISDVEFLAQCRKD
eukprot:12426233-Karenia_brevis.AAC.1